MITSQQKVQFLKINFIVFSLIFFIASCSNKESVGPANEPVTEKNLIATNEFPTRLVSSQLAASSPVSNAIIKFFAGTQGFGQDSDIQKRLIHDVALHRIVYKTTFQGKTYEASGLVILPTNSFDKEQKLPTLLGCHGTTFLKENVPSNINVDLQNFRFDNVSGFELFASAGVMVVVPDYIGFANTRETFHPYYIKEAAANTNIDMLYAATELAIKEGYQIDQRLFIAGYSEGGYTSMATHLSIESQDKPAFDLVQTYSGAGGYLPSQLLTTVIKRETYDAPAYLLYVSQAYNTFNIFSDNKGLNDIFKPDVAKDIPIWLDGTNGFGAINGFVANRQLEDLLTEQTFEDIKNDPNHFVLTALKSQGFEGAKTDLKLSIFQSRNDEVIPFENTKSFEEMLTTNGSTQVEFIEVQGGHGGAGVEAIKIALDKILTQL